MELEARLFFWCCCGAILFFLMAILSHHWKGDDSVNRMIAERKQRFLKAKEEKKKRVMNLVDDKTRAGLVVMERAWEEVYKSVFTSLRDEKPQFLDEAQAKKLEPWPRDRPRKVHCGGVATSLPRLITLVAKEGRCVPRRWISAMQYEREIFPNEFTT